MPEGTIVHTRPRRLQAFDVREGDELATFKGTGMIAGTEKGVRDADWRREIDWVDVVGPYSVEKGGIPVSGGKVVATGIDYYVVIRERVSVDA